MIVAGVVVVVVEFAIQNVVVAVEDVDSEQEQEMVAAGPRG